MYVNWGNVQVCRQVVVCSPAQSARQAVNQRKPFAWRTAGKVPGVARTGMAGMVQWVAGA